MEAKGKGAQARKAQQVLREAGTNTSPYLLRMLRETDSPLKFRAVALAQKQHLLKVKLVPAENWYFFASSALEALGPDAKDAVPELIRIFQENPSSTCQIDVAELFGDIGPGAKDAVPLLVKVEATTTNQLLRATALGALSRIHAEPDLVVPVLLKTLCDTNWSARVRRQAISGLSAFGTNANTAVPAVVDFLNTQSDPADRSLAAKALKKIDPEAAAGANLK